MTNIIDLGRERDSREHARAVELGRRIRELCDQLLVNDDAGRDDNTGAVIDALLRVAAGIVWDVEGEQPEMFIGLAAGVARRFWPDGQHGLKWNRTALKRILSAGGSG
jgi:hypothetical protein